MAVNNDDILAADEVGYSVKIQLSIPILIIRLLYRMSSTIPQ